MPDVISATRPSTIAVATRVVPIETVDPMGAYVRLVERFGSDEVFLLESRGGPAADSRHAILGFRALLTVSVERGVVRFDGEPAVARRARSAAAPLLREVDGELMLGASRALWDVLRAVQSAFSGPLEHFGFMSFFGYDTAHYVEDLPRLIEGAHGTPDVCVVLHQGRIRMDVLTGATTLYVHESDHWPELPVPAVRALLDGLAGAPAEAAPPVVAPFTVSDDTDEATFVARARRCLEHIAVGDIYQIQIGHELTIRSAERPLDVYRRLREASPSPYTYLARVAGQTLVGASPELFARVEDGELVMRPIAGTLPHRPGEGTRAEADGSPLLRDPKEIAEHVMLIDLCRNDIGQVCERGSLTERGMFVVERYSHVSHLVSTVVGRVGSADAYDIIPALFPAGTMTGAPKIRAMEIIESVETSRRGWYAGAVGLIDFNGRLNLALCIRTLFHAGDSYRIRASAGVVADSSPQGEWRETLAKMSAACWAVTGTELLPCEP